jgi:biopolymer transport protein ExbD
MAMSGPSGGDGADVEAGDVFADINITPLTDIFLVLLIIFMVTTTAIAESARNEQSGLKVDLPRGGAKAAGAAAHDVAIAVLEDGRLVVGGKVVDERALADILKAAAAASAETLVLVQADQGVPHGRVVAVMDLARRQGLARLAIATRGEAEGGAE